MAPHSLYDIIHSYYIHLLLIHVIGTQFPRGTDTTAHIKKLWLMVVTHLGMGGRGRGEGGDPPVSPTVGLPLQLKQPSFNWDGNVYENYKAFSERATILLGGPYAKYDDPSKISAFLS